MAVRNELISAIDRYLAEHRDELAELVAELVSIDSQIPPVADERAIIAFLRKRVSELGLGAGEVVARDPNRPNLIVRLEGSSGGRGLLFNGHVDTKPVGDAIELWNTDPLVPEIRDRRLYGLGASDMKGAVAAMVFAASAVRAADVRLHGDLVLAFVADEEAGASLGSRFIAPLIDNVDAALIGEPSGWERNWQCIHVVSRGVCCFRVRVRGTQMHSSLSDLLPSVNASRLMAELLVSLERDLDLECEPLPRGSMGPTVNVGVFVTGGVAFGVVPGFAEFGCDIRTLPGMAEASVRASVAAWLERERERHPGLDADVVFEPELAWVPPAEIVATHCPSDAGSGGRSA